MSKEKYCQSCGAKNKGTAKFCDDCGKPFDKAEKTTTSKPTSVEEGSGLGIISLVAAILGFTCLPGFGFIVAVITSLLAPNPRQNKYAKAGFHIGSLGLIVPVTIASIIGVVFSIIEGGDLHDDFMWVPILSGIGIFIAVIGLIFYIRWVRKPAE